MLKKQKNAYRKISICIFIYNLSIRESLQGGKDETQLKEPVEEPLNTDKKLFKVCFHEIGRAHV